MERTHRDRENPVAGWGYRKRKGPSCEYVDCIHPLMTVTMCIIFPRCLCWLQQDETPLSIAAECGHTDILKILLEAGADIHVSTCIRPVLHAEAAYGSRFSYSFYLCLMQRLIVLSRYYTML